MSIAGAVIVKNDGHTLMDTLSDLLWTDKIYIMDNGSTDNTLVVINDFWRKYGKDVPIKIGFSKVVNHFADLRNELLSTIDEEWVLMLDGDETLEPALVEELQSIAIGDNQYDAVAMRRRNYLNGKPTDIYPDFQRRFFRNFCRFVYPVHEELVGYRRVYETEYHIIHRKTTKEQEEQNNFYSMIDKLNRSKTRRQHEQW
jgi:glycosyltransferase involved in cell wall biosynthesis